MKETVIPVLFYVIASLCATYTIADVTNLEICTGDTFKPTCPTDGESILVLSAFYGRAKVGRCISQKEVSVLVQDIKYFGCSMDVLKILHKKCSLRKTCSIKIPDEDLDKTEPCFPGLKLYLQTEYKCIKTINEEKDCRIQVYSAARYLTSDTILSHSDCGRKNNPWLMEAPRGQKVKLVIEMLDESKDNSLSGITCGEEFGTVLEKHNEIRKNVTLCSNGFEVIGEQRRREQIDTWTSSGSFLELTFISEFFKSHVTSSNLPMILLKVESDGCLDIIPPEDTWLKRTGDDIVIGCYSSKQTWYLRCENKKWIGTIGNCSIIRQQVHLEGYTHVNTPGQAEISEEQQIILFVAICALGLLICMIIICLGAICIKRYKWKTKNDGIYQKSSAYYHNGKDIPNGQLVDDHYKSFNKCGVTNNSEFYGEVKNDEKPDDNKYFVLEDNCN